MSFDKLQKIFRTIQCVTNNMHLCREIFRNSRSNKAFGIFELLSSAQNKKQKQRKMQNETHHSCGGFMWGVCYIPKQKRIFRSKVGTKMCKRSYITRWVNYFLLVCFISNESLVFILIYGLLSKIWSRNLTETKTIKTWIKKLTKIGGIDLRIWKYY